jgi:hypothetical protein
MCQGFEETFGVQLVNGELNEDLSAKAHELADQRFAVLNRVACDKND